MPPPPANAPRISRRALVRQLSAGTLLSLGLWPGCTTAPNSSAGASFDFVVVNDTHYMTPECGGWLEKVVARIKSHPRAEFCLIVGDLVENGHREHLGAVADIFNSLRMPVYTQIGNHDYLGEADRAGYEAVFRNRLNYSFEHRGWQFVGIDSTEGTKYEGTSIQPQTLDWLRGSVPRLNRTRPTILFTHFPLGAGVKYRPANADAALDFFRGHNLAGVFNGHFHGQTERAWNAASVVTNRCCALKRTNHDGTKEKGYYLCHVNEGILTREFVPMPA